jgi:integrase
MSILAKCPICKRLHPASRKKCLHCGTDLDQAKRSGRVLFYINYRLPGGKQRRESVAEMEGLNGNLLKDAQIAHSKRTVQKRENRILDIVPLSNQSFYELTDWYLSLPRVLGLKSFWLIELRIDQFNAEFGDRMVRDVTTSELQTYQTRLIQDSKAPATVDQIIGKARIMINSAFADNLVSFEVKRTFENCKDKLKRGSDVRDRILSPDEYYRLMRHVAEHIKPIIATAYFTGMRRTKITSLTWNKVDLKNRIIQLDADITKTNESRKVPICNELLKVLLALPTRIKSTNDNENKKHLFQYHGNRITNFAKALKHACEKADILYGRFTEKGFIFHDLRHTFNTNMRKSGVQESVIMNITGHRTRAMFDRYNTIDQEDTRNAVNTLEDYFKNVDRSVDSNKKGATTKAVTP